ncbi:lipid IV(A) 4-amino-4-deoxy-L-arabinosyltransferase [secondary endosymbiont of Ctenarytaina eucalypti]|uniref:Undecaprenyl phosphate-alpha-4-amino-4-deoxy-L-arabinose arabinosyl transferase n=1 Tax=secondary endosymbiont of Ctenarytaina eucalypti TaxID=1199245 RepID=J3TXV6_9ENTR|nr:lipid IV(A) 4-amino-4-deoxy-L-arabinosyltransferase [secondary endosymbiont of Ctenarytaina eucalypti]AFP85120.1 PMT family glycosyltransferase, 4-amino-4-deoxy-L-arabinose transferase [secondary endosymbiont of Ctenarytaina eucalypti]
MKTRKASIGLLLVIVLYYVFPLMSRALWQPDETRYAEISREMLVSGDWIVPHFLGLRYFEKPAIGYWINNLGQWVFGKTNFAVHFGSTFSIILTALMVYWMAWRLWQDHRLGMTAVAIFSSCLLVYSIGTYAVLDPMVALCLAATMCSFWKAVQVPQGWRKGLWYLVVGVACGLGFMTKGFLALVVPLLSVMPWIIVTKRWKEVLSYGTLLLLGSLMISLPWVIAIACREPDFWHYFIWVEHIRRFAEDGAQHKAVFWYYLPVLLLGSLPWLALLPGALLCAWRERQAQSSASYLLGWAVMPLLFFSLSNGKLLTYILPCFAPLALLMARYATVWGGRALKVNGVINVLFGLLCVVAIAGILAPWGPVQHALFGRDEVRKIVLAVLGFLIWAAVGGLTLWAPAARWCWASLCPAGIALLFGYAIPQEVIDAKQPQAFIEMVRPQLENSRFILTDSVGVAAGLAWELERSDILLFSCPGELAYGLSYPDSSGRFVSKEGFSNWLHEHCKDGAVALVLLLPDRNAQLDHLPRADIAYRRGRLMLLAYDKSRS